MVRRDRGPTLLLGLLLGLAAGSQGGCAGPGGHEAGTPAHHLARGFRNLDPAFTRPGFWVRTTFFARRIWQTTVHPRSASLPRVPNDGGALRANTRDASVTWIGHATVLLQLDGINLLTDPQWSDRASPVSFAGPRRITPPGLRLEDLPPIHLVVISHDHYDHLDVATVERLWRRDHPRVLAPLGLKAWLEARGIDGVEELDWWESRAFRGLTVTCVPAQHWSARTLWDANRRLWSGWTVASRRKRFYFAGDSGYSAPMFREIGGRLGPFDLAAISIGAYQPAAMMKLTHTTPEETLSALEDVQGRDLVAIHWGTFDLTEEPIEEPPARLLAAARLRGLDPGRIWVLEPGETRRW
jgi:L-ascorbate metabolism protein UlaG (beta-lactamase superfamily)